MAEWQPLEQAERVKLAKLNDPFIELVLINGWRRNEIRQAIVNFIPNTGYVWIIPKKHTKAIKQLLTEREIAILENLKETTPITTQTKATANRWINRHFEKIQNITGVNVHPHRLRKTNGTDMDRNLVRESVIQRSLHHKNRKQTLKYIMPNNNDVLEAKKDNAELNTLDGMNINEWKEFARNKIRQIRRLERELEREREKNKQ